MSEQNSTVRTNGQTAASAIRQLGLQAKKTGDELCEYAEEVASAIESASERVSASIENYVGSCDQARTWLDTQRQILSELPKQLLPRDTQANGPQPSAEQSFDAVERAMDDVRRQYT